MSASNNNGNDSRRYHTHMISCAAALFTLAVFGSMALADLNDPNERRLVILIWSIGGILGLCSVIIAALGRVVSDAVLSRRAALRAIGKHGIRVIAKDKTARTAYKGIRLLLKGKYPQSEEALTKALGLSDMRQNQIFCVEWLIRLYEETENESRLLWCYRKAAEYAPENPEAQSRLGYAYINRGMLDKAMYCFEQALRYDPNNGYSYYSMAKIHLIRGEDSKALDTLQTLIKVHENHPLAYAELATYYAMHNDSDECRKNYDLAISCGYADPDRLSRRITAIYQFNQAPEVTGADLPREYYRRIEKGE